MTILIVDDDLDDISFIKEVVSEIDPRVTFLEARDGVEALQKLDTHSAGVSLVIMDIKMPKLNGIDCLAQMREKFPRIPVILFSSVILHRIPEQDKQGAVACIQKPSTYSDMRAIGHIFTNLLYSDNTE